MHGDYTAFSDVDISVLGNEDILDSLIYGYGQPVYISYTKNPQGILIVIYADGVALDLEIIEKIDISGREYFHRTDIKALDYIREEKLCTHFALCEDTPYQISRLFHRSLIKFLSGKRDNGVSIINEVVSFLNSREYLDEKDYYCKFSDILRSYNERFPLPVAYYELLCGLIENLNKPDSCK